MENELEKFINNNRDSFDRQVPDPLILNRVLEQMQANDKPVRRGIVVSFRVVIWAAASLVLMAFGIVYLALRKAPETIAGVRSKPLPVPAAANPVAQAASAPVKSESSTDKGIRAVDEDLAARKQALAEKLNGQRSASGKEVMFAGLSNMESPASRINAAAGADKLSNIGNDVVNALVNTLNTDPNSNVRLAALDGLARFYRETYVRKKLLASLKKQQDPVVQITMINLLIRMRESGILDELDNIVHDDNTQQAVKDCAYSGILQLRAI